MQAFDLRTISTILVRAALEEIDWSKALEFVARSTDACGALLIPVAGNLPLVHATASMQEAVNVYMSEGWNLRDERYNGAARFLRDGVVTDDDCMAREARRTSGFYQDFLARCGLEEFAGVRIGRRDNIWNLSIQRSLRQDPYSAGELASLAKLAQRLDPVIEVSCALAFAHAKSALDAFQFSDRAAVLVDRAGEVVLANTTADSILGEDLTIVGRRLVSYDEDATRELDFALDQILWRESAVTSPPVVFPKQNGGRLVIYPMRLRGMTDSPLSAFHAILVIADTNSYSNIRPATLKLVFGLTAAEARLAVAIANGTEIDGFSRAAGISKQTARNHLKSIFRKTGVERQHELAYLLGNLVRGR